MRYLLKAFVSMKKKKNLKCSLYSTPVSMVHWLYIHEWSYSYVVYIGAAIFFIKDMMG